MKIAATSLFLMQKDKGRFALQNSALATVQEEKKKGGGRKGRRGEENGGEGGREVGGERKDKEPNKEYQRSFEEEAQA